MDHEKINTSTSETEAKIVDTTSDNHPEKIRHFTKKKLLLLLLAIVLLASGIGYGVYAIQKNEKKPTSSTTKQVDHTVKIVATLPQTKDVFFSQPKAMKDLGLVQNTAPLYGLAYSCYGSMGQVNDGCTTPAPVTVNYQQIGTNSKGEAYIVAIVSNADPANPPFTRGAFLFAQTGTDSYSFYQTLWSKMELGTTTPDATSAQELKTTFSSKVTIDSSAVVSSLEFPQTVTIAGSTFNLPTSGSYTGVGTFGNSTQPSNSIKLGSTGNITFYKVIDKDSNGYQAVSIQAYIGTYTIKYEQYDTMVGGNGYLQFDNPTSHMISASQLMSRQTGCGGGFGEFIIVKNPTITSLVKIGTGPSGQVIYQFINPDPLLNFIYATDYANGIYASDASLQNLTLQQFQDEHAVMLVKNSLGDYQIYLRNDMFSQGQCGKPVIYLYPTHTQTIGVKVGANVTTSIPSYGINGWQNIIAQPNGTLSFQNEVYPNLFWEGTGNGSYPAVNQGVIVRSSDAVATITSQLRQQGLNQNEIKDFLDYWTPKLPNSPYVRLTWFNTSQMNELAPLSISPAPKTVIRVFLDFQAVQKPYNLKPQSLSSVPRNGFTVVEWGGLLR
jgi:hypothetical protein